MAHAGPPDLAQMIERMPRVALDALETGETVVLSSTKGDKPNELTAIVLVANADMLVPRQAELPAPQTSLELPAILP